MEGWSKKEKGLMTMDNSVVIVGVGGIRGLDGNGKKMKLKKKKEKSYRNSILFSTVAALICIPTSSALGFPFLHILAINPIAGNAS